MTAKKSDKGYYSNFSIIPKVRNGVMDDVPSFGFLLF